MQSELILGHSRDTTGSSATAQNLQNGAGWSEEFDWEMGNNASSNYGSFYIQTRASGNIDSNVTIADISTNFSSWVSNGAVVVMEVRAPHTVVSPDAFDIDSRTYLDSGTVRIGPNEGGLDLDHARPQSFNKDIVNQSGLELLNSGTVSNVATVDILLFPYDKEYTDFYLQLITQSGTYLYFYCVSLFVYIVSKLY